MGRQRYAAGSSLHQTVIQVNTQVIIPDRYKPIAQLLNTLDRLFQVFEIQKGVKEKRGHTITHHQGSLGVFNKRFRRRLLHFDKADALRNDEAAKPIHSRIWKIMPGCGVVDRRDAFIGRIEVFCNGPVCVLRRHIMRGFPGDRINVVGKAFFQSGPQFLLDNILRVT